MSDQTKYEVRVTGLLSSAELQELSDIEMSSTETRTVLRASLEDQAALYGLLNRLRSLGLEIVEVRRVSSWAEQPSTGDDSTGRDTR